jgi:SAM-dependent methyltransferase
VISALRSLLEFSWAYQAFGALIGAEAVRKEFVRDFVRPRPGERILDVGCGPGTLVPYLEGTDYVGVEPNPEYVETARARYGPRATFQCDRVRRDLGRELPPFQIVIASGVLHHLDDEEAGQLMELAHQVLVPGGRLVTLDGCFTEDQGRLARLILSRDRGRHVRTADEYVGIASRQFREVSSTLRTGLLRIPYTHVMLECRR